MSRFSHVPLLPGVSSRAAATVNAMWTAAAAASSAVDAENFAEEGLDRTVLVTSPVARRTGLVDSSTRAAASLPVSAVFAQFVQNATVFRLTGAPASLEADEVLRIRFRTYLATSLAAGLGIQGGMAVRLAYNNGAITQKVPYSEANLTKFPLQPTYNHGNIVTEGYLFGPIATLAWFEAQYTLTVGGVAFPARSFLTARISRRQRVV